MKGILADSGLSQSFNAAGKLTRQNWRSHFVKPPRLLLASGCGGAIMNVVQRLSTLIEQQKTMRRSGFRADMSCWANEYQDRQPQKAGHLA